MSKFAKRISCPMAEVDHNIVLCVSIVIPRRADNFLNFFLPCMYTVSNRPTVQALELVFVINIVVGVCSDLTQERATPNPLTFC